MRTSPFPGMDPYLEGRSSWKQFHDWFIHELARDSMPRARELGCHLGLGTSVYGCDSSGELMLWGEPDSYVTADYFNGEAPRSRKRSVGGVALAQPRSVREITIEPDEYQPHKQKYLVVRETRDGHGAGKVLAVVELLSLANKEKQYAKKYREKRARILATMTHFMEIDLLRAGKNPSRELFPDLSKTAYFIFVARQHSAGRHEEGYPIALRDPLPIMGLPLSPDRSDLPLDLAKAFRSAYDLGYPIGDAYEKKPPPPKLSQEDQAWVDEVLQPIRTSKQTTTSR